MEDRTITVNQQDLALWEALLAMAVAAKTNDALGLLNITQALDRYLLNNPNALLHSIEVLEAQSFESIQEMPDDWRTNE